MPEKALKYTNAFEKSRRVEKSRNPAELAQHRFGCLCRRSISHAYGNSLAWVLLHVFDELLWCTHPIPAKWALEDDYGVVWEISQILAGYGGVEGI